MVFSYNRPNDYSPSRNYSHYNSYGNRGRNTHTTTSTIAGTGHYSNYRRRQSHNDFYFYNNNTNNNQRGRRNDSYGDYDDRRDSSRWWERGANRWDNGDPYHWETSYGYRGYGGGGEGGGGQGYVFDQRRWDDRSSRR